MISLSVNGWPHAISRTVFSGGEVQVRLADHGRERPRIDITAHLHNSEAIMELLMVTDAARRMYPRCTVHLKAPYLPYARQDRVCAPGEALSVRVMCDLINAQHYDGVEIWDCHSDVGAALLDRCVNKSAADFVKFCGTEKAILVAPDAGALKKVSAIARQLNTTYIRADKTRDPKTGEITGTVAYSKPVGAQNLLIVDDICDGGRTFIELARMLKPLTTGKIELYVTHGIFSQGLEVFGDVIDRVYCPNVFPSVPNHPILERLKP